MALQQMLPVSPAQQPRGRQALCCPVPLYSCWLWGRCKSQQPSGWRVREPPWLCWDTAATGSLRGHQAWPEEGAGAPDKTRELVAVPVPEGRPCSLARIWCPERGLQGLRGSLGLGPIPAASTHSEHRVHTDPIDLRRCHRHHPANMAQGHGSHPSL